MINLDSLTLMEGKCLLAQKRDKLLWHRKEGYVNMKLLKKLSKKELMRGLPPLYFEMGLCEIHQRETHKELIQIKRDGKIRACT